MASRFYFWIDRLWQWIAETVFVRFEFDLPRETLGPLVRDEKVTFTLTSGGLIEWLILSSWCRSQGLGAILVANRKRIELKFQQMQDYARQTVNASNLKFFWAALLYKNASSLPFARYPFDARYKDWRLLSFEPAEDNSAGSPVPDLASLGVFRSELKAWAAG